MNRQALEVSLSLLAAVGGTMAAVVGTLSAFRDAARDELERSPAIHLACRPEFRAAEIAQNIKAPEQTFLLTESGGQWVHVGGSVRAPKAGQPAAPEPFARCDVKNYGRLPVLNIRVPVHVTFFKSAPSDGKTIDAVVDVPGLSADTAYEFSLLNGTSQNMAFRFDRTAELGRVDRSAPVKVTMYVDRRLAELEAHPARPTLAAAAAPSAASASSADEYGPPKTSIVIDNFRFKPAQVRIARGSAVAFDNHDDEAHSLLSSDKTVASGAIDPHGTWTYVFAKPGRYALHCDYHPYMAATVIVE